MEKWSFVCPTRLCFDEEGVGQIGAIVSQYGFKRVFIVYGQKSFVASGNLEKVTDSLNAAQIVWLSQGGVEANPDISFVRATLEKVRLFKPNLLLACGGGSVIDAAKSIAHGYYYDGDPLDFNRQKALPGKALPLGVILTLSASGSEMSSSCVISDRSANFKKGFNAETNYPTFALLVPELTYGVSRFQTACGLVDIISHSFERFFCPSQDYELADYLALSVIKTIVKLTPAVLANPQDYEARRSMMICGLFSHNGWTGIGKNMRMICHGAEHLLSGQHPEIAHGAGLRFFLAEFIRLNYEQLESKIALFGQFVFDEPDPRRVYDRFEKYLASLPLSQKMSEVGISAAEEKQLLDLIKLN